MLLRRRPVLTALVLFALVIPITYEIGVGNVNALLLVGAVGVWLLAVQGRSAPSGVLAGVMVAVS